MGKPWENGGLANLVMTNSLLYGKWPLMVGFPIKHGDFPYLSYQRLIFGCLWDPQDLQETEFSTASGTWAVFLIYLPSWFMLSHTSQGLFAGSRCPAR